MVFSLSESLRMGAAIERSYGRWMPKGVDRGIRSLRAVLSNTTMSDAKT
jgi:hypothetical protein